MSVNHIHPVWLDSPMARTLARALGEENIRFVGGCVRDCLLGKESKDFDVATILLPEIVIQKLQQAHVQAIPTGVAHGTITAIIDAEPVQITTLRRDQACDGRHAQVEYTTVWHEDAQRRDFTMNALYLSLSGEVTDTIGGTADLQAGIVRFIGDAHARITEDYLRILRFFRFQATYGKTPPMIEALEACAAQKEGLQRVSGERVHHEMFRLLSAFQAWETLGYMQHAGILSVLGVSVQENLLMRLNSTQHVPPNPLLRLGILLAGMSAQPSELHTILQTVIERWRLSNAQINFLKTLLFASDWPAAPQASLWYPPARKYGVSLAVARAWLGHLVFGQWSYQDVQQITQTLRSWNPPRFPITGEDLLRIGFTSGPRLGAILQFLEQYWENGGYQENRESLLAMAQQQKDAQPH